MTEAPHEPTAPRASRAFWRLSRDLLDPADLPAHTSPESSTDPAQDPAEQPPSAAVVRRAVQQSRVQRAWATYARQIAAGTDTTRAQVATVRALIAASAVAQARAFCMGLAQDEAGDAIRRLGLGVTLFGMRRYSYAWKQLGELPIDFLAEHAPLEAVHCGLADGGDAARATVASILADPTRVPTEDLGPIAGRLLVSGLADDARRLVTEADRRPDLEEAGRRQIDGLARWLHPADSPAIPAGRVTYGVIDYYQPDLSRASRNLGDYVQTLAMLGNLARYQDATFHGAGGLGEIVTRLQERVREPLRRSGGPEIELVELSRDYSEGDVLPPDTWALVFGWHLHSLFDLRFGLPPHPHLNPLFLSFHLQHPRALTPETVDYLRAHGPIGCRDWHTADLLLSAGVPAFFSGCLTTTVSTVFPEREQARDDDQVVAVVDLPPGAAKRAKRPVEHLAHGDTTYQAMDLAAGVTGADELMWTYLRRYHRVVTSRLHSYLPATSLGIPTSFRPRNDSDIRFEGLAGFSPDSPDFARLQSTLRDLIADAFDLVFSGRPRAEVYQAWSARVAPLVEQARARLAAGAQPAAEGTAAFDPAAAVATVRAGMHRYGPTLDTGTADIALSLDANMRDVLPVTLESIVTNSSGPLRFWVTSRGLDEDYRRWVAGCFPDAAFTFMDFDQVEYGDISRMIGHITIATMDRLLLPEVLPDLDRVTYIDLDTLTLSDVHRLASTELGGAPLAARTAWTPGPVVWQRVGDHLDPPTAHELRRQMARRHPWPYETLNAGVLVMDLHRMREDGFVTEFVPMAAAYGLNDQDILLAYAGSTRAHLPDSWNVLPVNEPVAGADLVHYAGAGKPWSDPRVPAAELWRLYADRSRARRLRSQA